MTKMNLQKYILLCGLVFMSVVLFYGCAGSSNEIAVKSDPFNQLNREKALEHFINGSMYDQKEDYANAILEYQDALRYDNDPGIFYAISRDYSILRKHALAVQAAREAISIAPNEIKYRENLGEIYINAGELENAIASYNNVINLDSNNTDAWYRLARLHQFKQPLKALEVYTQMLRRFGPSLEVLMPLSQLYTILNKTDDAIKTVKSILDMDPTLP
jgi:tetratricopeptide (TPR) repeat protein